MVVGSVMETVQEDTEQKVEAAHRDAASQQLADLLGASFNLVRWGSSLPLGNASCTRVLTRAAGFVVSTVSISLSPIYVSSGLSQSASPDVSEVSFVAAPP
jgi:hypothetical protein